MNTTNIPSGDYCYKILSYDRETRKLKTRVYPYWSRVEDKPEQKNGYCLYLGYGDW